MKTTLIKLSSFLMFVGIANLSMASGNIKSQSRNVETFTGIKLKNSANVYVTQGTSQSVKIEAEQSAITKITTEVKDGKLIISNDGTLNTDNEIKITITMKELYSVSIEGSGNIISKSTFSCKDFKANTSGSGNITMMIDAANLDAGVTGSGNITLAGKATKSKLNIIGSGDVNIKDLATGTASITIAGSGNCKVNSVDNLEANITGSGNILYEKEPAHHSEKITGSGELKKN